MHDDDAVLLRRYTAHADESAFSELVRRHIDTVYSAALRRVGGDEYLAWDVTQQVFIVLARKAAQLCRHPALAAWLYVTTRRQTAEVVRRERRRKAREREAHVMEQLERDEAGSVDWHKVAPVLDALMDELSDADRTAIVLRYMDRRSFAEIGSMLRTSEDAARMRVGRGLEKLRVLLGRRGIASSATALASVLAEQAVLAAPTGLASSVSSAAVAAGAGTASVSAGAILAFMSTSKAAAVAAGVFAAAMVSTYVYEAINAQRAEVALQDAKMGFAWHRSTRRQGETVAVQSLRGLQSLQRYFQQKRSQTRDTKAYLERLGYSAENIEAGRQFLARHPELQEVLAEYCRARVRQYWEPALRQRSIPRDRIEQMIEYQLTMPGNSTVCRLGDGPIAGPDGETLVFVLPGLDDPAKRTRLASELQQWNGLRIAEAVLTERRRTDEQSMGWQTAGVLAEGLYHTPEPLRPDQAEKLATLFAANMRVTDLFYDGDAVVEGARSFLSPRQLEFFELLNARCLFEAAITRAIDTESAAQTKEGGRT